MIENKLNILFGVFFFLKKENNSIMKSHTTSTDIIEIDKRIIISLLNPSFFGRQPSDFLKRYVHAVILPMLFWAIDHKCITIQTFITESAPWKSCRSVIPDMMNTQNPNKNLTLTRRDQTKPKKLGTYSRKQEIN